MPKSLVSAALVVAAGALVVGGCSAPESEPGAQETTEQSQAAQQFNDADVAFAREMIVHHEGALTMARLVDGRTRTPEIVDLAGRIERAQQPEIDTMNKLLAEWGEAGGDEAEGDEHSEHGGHGEHGGDSGHAEMPGMGQEEMAALERSEGGKFDQRFLRQMIAHHEGAAEMSEQVLAEGRSPETRTLAREIIDAQRAEIAEMRALLKQS